MSGNGELSEEYLITFLQEKKSLCFKVVSSYLKIVVEKKGSF